MLLLKPNHLLHNKVVVVQKFSSDLGPQRDVTSIEFVFQAIRFVGCHHTQSVPILVLIGDRDQLHTHIQDDNLFTRFDGSNLK